MGYNGDSFKIPCNRGGLNADANTDLIAPEMMILAKNINLHEGGRGKRGGTAKVNGTVITDTPIVTGVYDFMIPGGSAAVVFGTSDGKIWKSTSATITTGLTASKKPCFETAGKKLFVCNGYNPPLSWDGGAGNMVALANIPADWTGTNYPSQFLMHGRGNSQRLWALGCPGTPYTIYVTPNNSFENFADASVSTFNIDTGDSFGVFAGVDHLDKMICFGKTQAYVIDDADTVVSNWGYTQAPWTGGAASRRLVIKTPTDIICMMDDGEIYSVSAAQQYGDYKQASLVQTSHIHKYIKDNVRLSYIDEFHGVYDPNLKAVKIWVVRTGQTTADTCLVYFVDRGPAEGWVIHDNSAAVSGYAASSSALIRVGAGDYQIYTGGYTGFIWKLEYSTRTDDGAGYYGGFKTAPLTFGNERLRKNYARGWLVLEPKGTETLTINWWVDGVAQTAKTITAVSGTRDYGFDLGQNGNRVQFEIYNSTVDFFISQLMIDHKKLGANSE